MGEDREEPEGRQGVWRPVGVQQQRLEEGPQSTTSFETLFSQAQQRFSLPGTSELDWILDEIMSIVPDLALDDPSADLKAKAETFAQVAVASLGPIADRLVDMFQDLGQQIGQTSPAGLATTLHAADDALQILEAIERVVEAFLDLLASIVTSTLR